MQFPDEIHYEGKGTTDRLTEQALQAIKRREHLWIATTAWFVSDPTKEQLLLDRENLAMEPVIGCFVCEQEYERRLTYRACPGEPRPGEIR